MDAPEEFWPSLNRFLDEMPERLNDIENLLTDNEIIVSRTQNVAVLDKDDAINASIT